jgi:5-methylcytosine-specific restriction endonuclease McrA
MWAQALDVDDDGQYVAWMIERLEELPPDEREATERAYREIGPAMIAQVAQVQGPMGVSSWVEERAGELIDEVRSEQRAETLAQMPYHEYLRTPEWSERADATYRRFDYRCAVCNADGDLHAHHRTYERRGSEHDNDLVALCPACHSLFHEWRRLATS